MTGCNVGFSTQLEQFLGRTLLKYHCIIYQESLCGKSLQIKDVKSVVVKCVYDIRAAALKRRKFRQLLNDLDGQYEELLLHAEVRWLSRGKVLARFLVWTDGFVPVLANCFLCGTEATLSFSAGPVCSSFSVEACAILHALC